jgi:hypothetical protein
MKPATNRRGTQPGIGDPSESGHAGARRVIKTPMSCLTPAARASGTLQQQWTSRQTMPIVPDESGEWEPEIGTRPMPRCLDDVGPATVAVGLGMDPFIAPKCLVSPAELRRARIDPKDAFVLSLVDGTTSLRGIIDESGMREDVAVASLDRLAQLGFVTLS